MHHESYQTVQPVSGVFFFYYYTARVFLVQFQVEGVDILVKRLETLILMLYFTFRGKYGRA